MRGNMNQIFKVTITNWYEHNPNKKKTYKKTLIANNMIHDARICAMPTSHRWLFFGLLLIAGDYANDTVTITEQQVNNILTARVGAENALMLLQQYQLVTFEKSSLNKEKKEDKERNRKEKKPKGKIISQIEQVDVVPPDKNVSHLISEYCLKWKQAYKTEQSPIIKPKDAKDFKSFLENVGFEKAKLVVENYFEMGDKWFLTKRHDMQTMLNNLNAIIQFSETKRLVTSQEINTFEKNQTNKNTLDALRNGEI